jgi:hypothetical protein
VVLFVLTRMVGEEIEEDTPPRPVVVVAVGFGARTWEEDALLLVVVVFMEGLVLDNKGDGDEVEEVIRDKGAAPPMVEF